MLLTRECEYALRILRALKDGNMQQIKNISETQHIPKPFVFKVVKKLNNAGILDTRRGAGGGCILAKPLDAVTLYEVVNAVGVRVVYECIKNNATCVHNVRGECSIHHTLQGLQNTTDQYMHNKTIAEIVF